MKKRQTFNNVQVHTCAINVPFQCDLNQTRMRWKDNQVCATTGADNICSGVRGMCEVQYGVQIPTKNDLCNLKKSPAREFITIAVLLNSNTH